MNKNMNNIDCQRQKRGHFVRNIVAADGLVPIMVAQWWPNMDSTFLFMGVVHESFKSISSSIFDWLNYKHFDENYMVHFDLARWGIFLRIVTTLYLAYNIPGVYIQLKQSPPSCWWLC